MSQIAHCGWRCRANMKPRFSVTELIAQHKAAKASQAALAVAEQPVVVTQNIDPPALPSPPADEPVFHSSQHAWARHLPSPQSSSQRAIFALQQQQQRGNRRNVLQREPCGSCLLRVQARSMQELQAGHSRVPAFRASSTRQRAACRCCHAQATSSIKVRSSANAKGHVHLDVLCTCHASVSKL